MAEKITGDLVIKSKQKFAIVVADFNSLITARLEAAAVDCLLRHGASEDQITQYHVPGSFEIPTVAQRLAESGRFAAIICLGCVIRGETSHYDQVVQQVSRGIGAVGPATGVPTIFGVITADTVEQAMDRSGLKMGNIGWSAGCSAIKMANLMTALPPRK